MSEISQGEHAMCEQPKLPVAREKKELMEHRKYLEMILRSHKEACEYVQTKLKVLRTNIDEENDTLSKLYHWQDVNRLDNKTNSRNDDSIKEHEAELKKLHSERSHWISFDNIFHKYRHNLTVIIQDSVDRTTAKIEKLEKLEEGLAEEGHNHD